MSSVQLQNDIEAMQGFADGLTEMLHILPLLNEKKALSDVANYVGLLIYELSERFDNSVSSQISGVEHE